MAKRVNPMAVKSNATYEIVEAARALGVTSATIRIWIKDGMEAMTASKPYLILGASIRAYLKIKYAAARSPLMDKELYCLTCRKGCKPLGMRIKQSQVSAKTDLMKGVCERCGGTATRMISHQQREGFEEDFEITKEANSEA